MCRRKTKKLMVESKKGRVNRKGWKRYEGGKRGKKRVGMEEGGGGGTRNGDWERDKN